MNAPPLQLAANPPTRIRDDGTPRGNKLTAHRGRLLEEKRWRVVTEPGETLREGDIIAATLRYALEAPNGRRVPIAADDLHSWLDDFYRPAENKKRHRIALVRDVQLHGMWAGGSVGEAHLQCGDWRIIQSDEAVVKISQMHTQPLSRLEFGRTKSGVLVARYPEEKNNPRAVEFGDESSTGAHTETITD